MRLRDREQVVVALQIARMIVQPARTRAAEIGFAEPLALHHRPHRAVEHEDALVQQAGKLGGAVGLHANSSDIRSARSTSPGTTARTGKSTRISSVR
jgi:hypothetical protein